MKLSSPALTLWVPVWVSVPRTSALRISLARDPPATEVLWAPHRKMPPRMPSTPHCLPGADTLSPSPAPCCWCLGRLLTMPPPPPACLLERRRSRWGRSADTLRLLTAQLRASLSSSCESSSCASNRCRWLLITACSLISSTRQSRSRTSATSLATCGVALRTRGSSAPSAKRCRNRSLAAAQYSALSSRLSCSSFSSAMHRNESSRGRGRQHSWCTPSANSSACSACCKLATRTGSAMDMAGDD
mmetsp:Transcript_16739/g.36536  ORF Transcript_16739/g.36536 Transcript_16739/m.36536 type:complete len:245 (-) Transcript_16739:454-1188(-)